MILASRRPFRAQRSLLIATAVALLISAGTAQAQHGGPIPGMNPGLPIGHNWDITTQDLSNVEIHELKKAYKEGVKDLQAGACRSAASKFEFVLEHVRNDADVEYVAATAYRCLKEFRTASEHYEAVLELDDEHYASYRFLGVSRLAVGDFHEATRQFASLEAKFNECDPKCPKELGDAYASLHKALKYVRKKRAAGATPEPQ